MVWSGDSVNFVSILADELVSQILQVVKGNFAREVSITEAQEANTTLNNVAKVKIQNSN